MVSEQLAAYLLRIGYDGPVRPDLETLDGMHRAHWRSIPFENLSIRRGERIVTDPVANLGKVVERRRGGFCLELSGLFAWALREIGFRVDVLGGRGLAADGSLTYPNSHMCLVVHLDEPWLADVGFGGNISRPLRLHDEQPQADGPRTYRVANDGDHWFVTCIGNTFLGARVPNANQTYLFTLEPKTYADFDEVCDWLQTSPDSPFVRGDLVSLSSEAGRTTFARGRLIVTDDQGRSESDVAPAQVDALLQERFGLVP